MRQIVETVNITRFVIAPVNQAKRTVSSAPQFFSLWMPYDIVGRSE